MRGAFNPPFRGARAAGIFAPGMGRFDAWSAEEDGALRRACEAGTATAEELARQLGRPRTDVRERARLLGLVWSRVGAGHRWSANEDGELRRAVEEGQRVAEIAQRLDRRSPAAI